jgi:NADH-quinone oxidoreductase subunit L
VIGSLALCGIPPFAGFFSKDAILEAVHHSRTPGAGIAYAAVLVGVFVTALYSFRLLFMTFHGKPRFEVERGGHGHGTDAAHGHGGASHGAQKHDDHGHDDHGHGGPPKESPWVVTLPLIALAVPSVYAGWAYIEPMLFRGFFKDAIVVAPEHDVLAKLGEDFHGAAAFVLHGLTALPFWLAVAGIVVAWYLYLRRPELPERIAQRAKGLYVLLQNKYYFDELYEKVFAAGARGLGRLLWRVGDVAIIDGFFVNGAARVVGWTAGVIRRFQSGFIYHYAFMMIIGVFLLLTLWITRA